MCHRPHQRYLQCTVDPPAVRVTHRPPPDPNDPEARIQLIKYVYIAPVGAPVETVGSGVAGGSP